MNTPNSPQHYVAGFAFDLTMKRVALIKKEKPDWQRGKFNGIGGKIEEGESAEEAMRREFLEEAGVDVNDWRQFCVLSGDWGRVVFFMSFLTMEKFSKVGTQTDEYVGIFNVSNLSTLPTIPNVQWLIPMEMSFGDTAERWEVTEVPFRA